MYERWNFLQWWFIKHLIQYKYIHLTKYTDFKMFWFLVFANDHLCYAPFVCSIISMIDIDCVGFVYRIKESVLTWKSVVVNNLVLTVGWSDNCQELLVTAGSFFTTGSSRLQASQLHEQSNVTGKYRYKNVWLWAVLWCHNG